MELKEECVKKGFFWIPGKRRQKIPGLLILSTDIDIKIDLSGSLNSKEEYFRVIGYVDDFGFVTLESCFVSYTSFSSEKEVLIANMLLVGVNLNKNKRIMLESLSFSVQGLNAFAWNDSFDYSSTKEDGIVISYKPANNIRLSLDDGITFELFFPHNFSRTFGEYKITQDTHIKLTSHKLNDLDSFLIILNRVLDFLCFAFGEIVSLTFLSAVCVLKPKESKEIKIFYQSHFKPKKLEANKSRSKMLFTYKDIEDNASVILSKWLSAYSTIGPAMNLYFATQIHMQNYPEVKFLFLVQGLETYHRRTSDIKKMSQEDFDLLISEVEGKLSGSKHIEFIKARLAYANEVSLAIRLKDIITPFKDVFVGSKSMNSLIRKIVDTRNYLTHYDERLKEKSAGISDMMVISKKMELIFQFYFFRTIGFTDSEINDFAKRKVPLINRVKYSQL